MNTEEENALRETSRSMKSTVQIIHEQMHQQDLLCESIEADSAKNSRLFYSNMNKFRQAVRRMNRDPRNKIIFILMLAIIACSIYLLA